MAPPRKTLQQYEAEATWEDGCLIHPSINAYRKVYQLRHGIIPKHAPGKGPCVCHTCDNPKCILDKHHFLGSRGDNVRDAVNKGRHPCGQNGPLAGKFGSAHPFYGKHQTPATRKKISKAAKKMWAIRKGVVYV